MNEICSPTGRQTFLHICMGIEKLCADLYHFYGELFEEDPEASRLWNKTAVEEENHQKQFELALRLLNESEFEVSDESLERAYAIQHKLLVFMDKIKQNKPELHTAVAKAVEMEEKLADLHAHTALKFRDESLQRLFTALSEADHAHVSDLRRFQTILTLPHCEMT